MPCPAYNLTAYRNMNRTAECLYLRELVFQADAALGAAVRANACLREHRSFELFREFQVLLSCAAAMSRILWPPRIFGDKAKDARAKERGKELRSALALEAGHGLEDRELRNHLEHFDERLDDWVQASQYHNVVDQVVAPVGAFGGNLGVGDILRQFDPSRNVFIFRGEEFDLQRLVTAIEDVHIRATTRLGRAWTENRR